MAKTRLISPPLPLPVRFALLPCLLPSKCLVPLLCSDLNELPIYITLAPSHSPHVGVLPLVLALSLSPLDIVKQLPLGGVSLDLAGNAPFVDLWVPFPVAKQLFERLGVGHLFGVGARAGLSKDEVEQMISWEEDGGMSHNWIPATLPISTYSLEILLSTPFGQIEIIPDERCISTPMGRDRRANLIATGEFDDPSRIRYGEWNSAWAELLTWTVAAWAEYSAYPSRPPKRRFSQAAEGIYLLLARLSHLSNKAHSHHPISAADIDAALHLGPIHDPSIPQLFYQLLHRLYQKLPLVSTPERSYGSRKQLESRARVQLGVVEMVGSQLVDIFSRDRGSRVANPGDTYTHHTHHRHRPDPITTGGPPPESPILDTEQLSIQPSATPPLPSRPGPHRPRTEVPIEESSASLMSEAVEGWWMYTSVAGAIIVAVIFGILPL